MMQKWFNRLYIVCYCDFFGILYELPLWQWHFPHAIKIWQSDVATDFSWMTLIFECWKTIKLWIWIRKSKHLHEIMNLKSGGKLNIWLVNETATWHKEKQHLVLYEMTSEWQIQLFYKKYKKHFKGNVCCRWRVWTAALLHFRQSVKAAFLPFCL